MRIDVCVFQYPRISTRGLLLTSHTLCMYCARFLERTILWAIVLLVIIWGTNTNV